MGQEIIEALVEGGKANAGPPLGPSLGMLKVNTKAVIEEINKKTQAMKGMQVPVKVIVNTETKEFEIEVGTPPVSALIKKELGVKKGAKEAGKERVGDLTKDQVKKIAETKFGNATKQTMNQVEGTARSMGVSVEQGEVSEEEKKAYEEAKKAKEAEAAAAKAAKDEAKVAEKPGEKKEGKPGEKAKAEGKQKEGKAEKKGKKK